MEMAPLTILTGMNGMGKSSVLQSMLVLRESVLKGDYPKQLNLIGDSFKVGKPISLLNWDIEKNPDQLFLSFTFDNEKKFDFAFSYSLANPKETRLLAYPEFDMPKREDLERYSLFRHGGLQYLSAFREGPQSDYGIDSTVVDDYREISWKLGKGEYAVYFLDKYGQENISVENMLYEGKDDPLKTLRGQVDKWLREISPDISVRLEKMTDTQYSLKYFYRRKDKGNNEVEAVNTGFGVSYILSVVVALLAARRDDIIMIENPEAHIHPSAQSALMRLISKACAGGVQVILETHSDHIVNGALVNLKLNQLQKKDVAIYFFDRQGSSVPVDIIPLSIGRDCRIKKSPDRFFSQMNSDLDILFDL